MDRVLLSRSLATVSAILAVAVPAVGGVVVSEHSHVENSISELGAVGTHWGRLISWGGFLPTGIIGIGLMVFAGTYFKRRPDKIAQLILTVAGVAALAAFVESPHQLWVHGMAPFNGLARWPYLARSF